MLEIQTTGWELRQREAKSGKEAIADQAGCERELPVFTSVEQFPLILFLNRRPDVQIVSGAPVLFFGLAVCRMNRYQLRPIFPLVGFAL